MVRTMSCIICTCLTGSGTLLTEQDTASFTAVSRDTLWPTDTYTGLAASCDVRTACVERRQGGLWWMNLTHHNFLVHLGPQTKWCHRLFVLHPAGRVQYQQQGVRVLGGFTLALSVSCWFELGVEVFSDALGGLW